MTRTMSRRRGRQINRPTYLEYVTPELGVELICTLLAELPQMMVDVLVHQPAPLFAGELAKEGVYGSAGSLRAARGELLDQPCEPRPLAVEVALVGDDERRVGRRALAERLRPQRRLSHQRRQDLADQRLLHRAVAGDCLERNRAVAEHLRRVHLPPLPRRLGTQRRDAVEQGLAIMIVEEGLHAGYCRPIVAREPRAADRQQPSGIRPVVVRVDLSVNGGYPSNVLEFRETELFTRVISRLLSDMEYAELQGVLVIQPDAGSLIPGTSGLRKLRWSQQRRGKGKRGGVRVIYYWQASETLIYMLFAYSKDEQDDLTLSQRKLLMRLVAEEFE